MPRGPQGQKRPADVVSNAVTVARLAVGEITEEHGTSPGRTKSGKAGGKARAQSLSKERRQEIAKKAAVTRWSK